MIDCLQEGHIRSLLEECLEKLDDVEACLVAMGEDNGRRSGDGVNRLLRGFDGIRGTAGQLEYEPLEQLSHAAETLLGEIRDGKIALTRAHLELLLTSSDRMRQMISEGKLHNQVEFGKELAMLNEMLSQPAGLVAEPVLSRPAGLPPHLRRLRVLVVEDDFSSRVVLQGLLSKYGECHVAVNGKEALEAFRLAQEAGEGYDLVCLDVRMPEMDGREALTQIRNLEGGETAPTPGVRIFMTTSVHDAKTVVGSFKSCDAYLFKPIDGRELEAQLRRFQLIGTAGGVKPEELEIRR